MFMATKKRVKSHVLEAVIGILMGLFGLSAIFIFFNFMRNSAAAASTDLAIIEILLIIVLAILAQTIVMIRVYEQNNK